MGHPLGCTAVPEADLRKAFSSLLMCREQGADCSKQRGAGCELEQSEFCSIHGSVKELLHLQEGPAAWLTHLPGEQATCLKQVDTICEPAVSEDVNNGICSRDGSGREPLVHQGTSAPGHVHRNILRRLLGECRAKLLASGEGTVSCVKARAGRCVAVSRCVEEASCSARRQQWLEAAAAAAPKRVQLSCCSLSPARCPWLSPQLCPCPCPGSWLSGCQLREGERSKQAERSLLCSPGIGGAAWRAGCGCGSQQLFPAAGEWFSCHPVLTSALIVLLVLVLALSVALAVQSAPQLPVPPATPQVLLLGCPSDWVGYNGVCYYLSNDSRSWEQSKERCSELGASLAILKDEEMDLFFRLRGNDDYWLGLRRRGEQLQWEDGSSFSSSVPLLGNSECVYLAEYKFRSVMCSNPQPYLCSKARAPL